MSQNEGMKLSKLGFLSAYVLSGSATILSKTVVAPFEKVQQVIPYINVKKGTPRLEVISICVKSIINQEGLCFFWKGNLTSCKIAFHVQSMNFALNNMFKKILNIKKSDSKQMVVTKNFLSGGFAGSLHAFLTYSQGSCKVRLKNDIINSQNGGQRQYSNLFDVYKHVMSIEGIRGLFRGFFCSCMGVFIYRSFYFGLYDSLKPALLSENTSLASSLFFAYSVSLISSVFAYPVDVVRRTTFSPREGVNYTGSLDCLKQIVSKEGVTPLFKGAVSTNIIKSIYGAGVLIGFDKLVSIYTQKTNV